MLRKTWHIIHEILSLLFIKYVSDRYAGQPYAPIVIPDGASFKDMMALKGKDDIGDRINKKIIATRCSQSSAPWDTGQTIFYPAYAHEMG